MGISFMDREQNKLRVKWVKVDALSPYANNPKEHPPAQVAQIANSIEAFGFNDPIAVDDNNEIIEGHGRLLAAQKLNLTKVPIIELGHLSEAEKRAYALAHNKLTLNTGWDAELLSQEFESIELDDLTLTGFSDDEIQQLLGKELTTDDSNDGDSEPVSIDYENQYGVIVHCDNEEHQQRVYDELNQAGYDCKVVVV